MLDVSKELKKIRKELGLSQTELADKLGITSQNLGYYERGRHKPKTDFFEKWKKLFGKDFVETNVSHETENHVNDDEVSYKTNKINYREKYVELLEKNNQLLEDKITESDVQQRLEAVEATLLALQESVLRRIYDNKNTYAERASALHKIKIEISKQKGIASDVGK